ncbi:hypothetical protein BCR41DRAFT_361152 [Lobosporangium transversale]|uniref:Uncharacterized protein n=1 Tax=Lobosporangium transversale TaxID=64571 RepID=A0A1Y2GD14_9FUNG|nr:hypothetical protein BCR41DRAFT_361152 [Lobosporangium transversale]ORZ06370.1 hypothetical protein BCR41DRAFT_361152 [Lobosporangium transversale]|eukprot:XP_021877533.1 hypothetical protein BCR41DRAFT_361152 [Lobosporangium transversale]
MNVTFEPEAEDIEAILQQSAELQSMNEAVDPEAVLYEQDEEDGELVMPLKRKLKEKPGTRKRPAIDMFEAGTDDPATITSTASSTPIVTQQQHRPQRPLTQADYDLSNALSERESILLASAVRKNNQARSTQEQYKAYQKHWNEWCERKRYSDDNTVTREKVLVYVRELLAPKVIIDEENPHLSVLPARVHKTESYEGDYPAYPTIAFYLKGIRDLYIQQCSDNNVAANVIGTTRVPEVIALLDGYRKEHHKRTSSQDVLQLTVGAGYPLSMFKKFMKISWSRSYKHLSAVSRTQK